jgi:U32 family peptidase
MQGNIEILAPAGDEACLDAALSAGADAVYFGLDAGFNARVRATNFGVKSLPGIMQTIHARACRGYLTLNTLVFDHELPALQGLISAAADAGVDAAIVQDLGIARLIKRLVPTLRIHASTQMTCTDSAGIELAAELGMSRVTLARELSLDEIRRLAHTASVELEAFVHGALCISYSGQCLTSEAIGGRSANRGACAQACRLPFEWAVDGQERGNRGPEYLLSPKDLDASRILPELMAAGVSAVKIEGRLKSPEYVAATTRLYRLARAAAQKLGSEPSDMDREFTAQFYSRGASLGFLNGTNHQNLVDRNHSDHVGVEVGTCIGLSTFKRKTWLRLRTTHRLTLGDGILVQGARAGGDELGGRIWAIRSSGAGAVTAEPSADVLVWLGPDRKTDGDWSERRVFRTSSPTLETEFKRIASSTDNRVPVKARLAGALGERPRLSLTTADNRAVEVALDQSLTRADKTPITDSTVREKLARLGDTPYRLDGLQLEIPDTATLPLSSLNRARREAVEGLNAAAIRRHAVARDVSLDDFLSSPHTEPPASGLFVACRTLAQAHAALEAGASGVYLDFLAMIGVGPALRELRARHAASIGIALPRIRKPGEETIDAQVKSLEPDALLLRSLGSLADAAFDPSHASTQRRGPLRVADFSLNITNTLSALECLIHRADAFTPSCDLDAAQQQALLDSPLAAFAEVVVHHPMPLFHMEHCVIAALLSDGHDHRDCGRPCDRHVVSLRDRKGLELPVEADLCCRNTVFHGVAQCAADQMKTLSHLGVGRFRIELLRESPQQAHEVVTTYRELVARRCSPAELRRRLAATGLPVVRGTLRVIG